MRTAVANDLRESAKIFKTMVWPSISHWFNGGELIPVEAVTNKEMREKLDTLAGIDAWHIKKDSGMRGIASRVQWIDKPYNTFTIRKERESGAETEYEKRKRAINGDKGWLYPEITIQAYVKKDKSKLLSVGAIKTKKLISSIDKVSTEVRTAYDRETGDWAKFYVVPWSELKGVKIKW